MISKTRLLVGLLAAAAAATLSLVSAYPQDGLKAGEYACYGSGGQILAGLGFKVLDKGKYTDLEATATGTYEISADTVTFIGGHLDGETGRELKNGHFRIAAQAVCEPY